MEKQTAKDFAAAKLADEELLGWPDAEVQRWWNEDSIGPHVLGLRQSKKPIGESNAVTCRALWWWRRLGKVNICKLFQEGLVYVCIKRGDLIHHVMLHHYVRRSGVIHRLKHALGIELAALKTLVQSV